MICAVCFGESLEEIERQISLVVNQPITVIEIRVDGLKTIDYERLGKIIKNLQYPVILTLRSQWKDIRINEPLEGRASIISKLIDLEPNYLDLEFPQDLKLIKEVHKKTTIVLSLLDFYGMAKIPIDTALDLVNHNSNIIIKIAATPNSIEDMKLLWKWSSKLSKLNLPNIIVGMGELGKVTRIKSLELKNLWMYGRAENIQGEPFIPGMLSIDTLNRAFSDDSWHFATIESNPRTESTIFHPILDRIIQQAELNGVFVDVPISNRVDLSQFLLWVNDGLLDGLLVSHPWQHEVLTSIDETDQSVRLTRRSNCIIPTKSGLKGYNTYVEAIHRSLTPYSKKKLGRVYIEGEGNYIYPIIAAIRDFADLIVVRGVREEDVKTVISDFSEVIPSDEAFSDSYDLVINNLSPEIGFEKISPIPPAIMNQAKLVFDPVSSIFTSSATLQKAEKLNIPTVSSWNFILNSLLYSFELLTKQSVPFHSINQTEVYDKIHQFEGIQWPPHSS